MSANAIPISEELFREVSEQADHTGMSAEQWISQVLADRVRVERQAEQFLGQRAAGGSHKTLGELLDKAPDRPPDAGDEFEP